jgi:hypothetical protein
VKKTLRLKTPIVAEAIEFDGTQDCQAAVGELLHEAVGMATDGDGAHWLTLRGRPTKVQVGDWIVYWRVADSVQIMTSERYAEILEEVPE